MTTPESLYDAVLTAAHDTAGQERVDLLRGLTDRLARYVDHLDDDPSHVAGLGIMRQVLDIIHDRETVPVHLLETITPETVTDLYDAHVGPAVDRVEAFLLAIP